MLRLRHAQVFGASVLGLLLGGVLAGTCCRRADENSSPVAEKPTAPSATTAAGEVVVYCSVDEEFGRQVFARYQELTGVEAKVVFDSEAGKTTGLLRKLEQEASRPRADVFWSSELFGTILLARQGLLAPYDSPGAADIPSHYRDPEHRWTAFGLRARVIAFDPTRVDAATLPTTWEELAEPKWAAQVAIANPLFGTTRGHVASMFALWGSERGTAYLTGLRDGGARIVDGNSAAVRAVIAGRVNVALTDTDDVWVAQRAGASMDLRYLDMGDGGTLLIPNSVAVVEKCPHPEAARRLVDFLVSPEVERLLAQSASRNIPVRPDLRDELSLELPPATQITFDSVADYLDSAVSAAREILLR